MKNKKVGGNGYSLNVSEGISGYPAVMKYTNNCSPVFKGELLQGGGCSSNCNCGNILVQTGGDCGCGVDQSKNKSDPLVFDKILENMQQTGGSNNKNKDISQFSAIKAVAEALKKLNPKQLLSIPTIILQDTISKKSYKKAEQFGGYVFDFQQLIAPLGRNNLLVLAALLLLHYFAVERKEQKLDKTSKKIKKGGSEVFGELSQILAPIGISALGASVLLVLLQGAFSEKYKKTQSGGNPLKNLIAPLGTEAFIATGLLIILEKIYTNSLKLDKAKKLKDTEKIRLFGGKIRQNNEKLFHLLSPISFNAFARQSFLDKISK